MTGFENVSKMLISSRAIGLILASDASEGSAKKMQKLIQDLPNPTIRAYSIDELDETLGLANTVHVGLSRSAAAEAFLTKHGLAMLYEKRSST